LAKWDIFGRAFGAGARVFHPRVSRPGALDVRDRAIANTDSDPIRTPISGWRTTADVLP
jgi:hypothetical protein